MDNDEAAAPQDAPPAFDRRRGPRRYSHVDPATGERRTQDRRKTPGVDALFDKLLGKRETIPEPPDPLDAESDGKP